MLNDLEVWDAVVSDLNAVLKGLKSCKDEPITAPIHHRLTLIQLECGLRSQVDSVRSLLGEGFEDSNSDQLLEQLHLRLDGDSTAAPVLSALGSSIRTEAMLTVHEALQSDGEYVPALRTAAALAGAADRWNEAVAWLERLYAVEPGERAAQPLIQLADAYWKKLNQPETARRYYIDARDLLGDDPLLLDKLLKLDLDLSNWADAVEVCHALIDLVGEGPDGRALKVTYLLTLGEIHVYGMQKPAEALAYYLEALDAMPDYALTYTLLRELLETHPWATLNDLLQGIGSPGFGQFEHYVNLLSQGAKAAPKDAAAIVSQLRDSILQL